MLPLVHILIPVYNHEKFLYDSLYSALNQSHANVKVIVVNDGSSENVQDVFDKFKNDSRLEVHHQENKGLPATLNALNTFSRESSEHAEYITWHSADNTFELDAIESMVAFLTNHQQFDMVYANVRLINEKNIAATQTQYRKDDQKKEDSSILNLNYPFQSIYQCNDNFINACFLMRSTIENRLPPYDKKDRGFEDYIHWLQLSIIGSAAHIKISKPLYNYRLHSETMTNEFGSNELSHLQKRRVQNTRELHNVLSTNNFSFYTSNSNKFIFLKNKSTHTLQSFTHFLSTSWNGETIQITDEKSENSYLNISKIENSLVGYSDLSKFIFKIPPLSAHIVYKESTIDCRFFFEGITNNLAFIARSRNRDTGMFSNDIDSTYEKKLLILMPTNMTETYISNVSQYIHNHQHTMFVMYAHRKEEKNNADKIYLRTSAAKNVRIVEDKLHTDFADHPLLHVLSSVNAILSNSLFHMITYIDAKLELVLSNLSLKYLYVPADFPYHTDNNCLKILELNNENKHFLGELDETMSDSFLDRANNESNLKKLISTLYIKQI